MRSLKEMRARKNDCRLKAIQIIEQAEKEDRFLTEEENRELTKLETEMRNWEKQIVRLEVFKGDFDAETKPKTEEKEDANTNNDSTGEADETEVLVDEEAYVHGKAAEGRGHSANGIGGGALGLAVAHLRCYYVIVHGVEPE